MHCIKYCLHRSGKRPNGRVTLASAMKQTRHFTISCMAEEGNLEILVLMLCWTCNVRSAAAFYPPRRFVKLPQVYCQSVQPVFKAALCSNLNLMVIPYFSTDMTPQYKKRSWEIKQGWSLDKHGPRTVIDGQQNDRSLTQINNRARFSVSLRFSVSSFRQSVHCNCLNAFLLVCLVTVCSQFLPKLPSVLFLSCRPYLPPLFFLLILSLCWGCLFSLSLCLHSSAMSVAEWSSVLCPPALLIPSSDAQSRN